VIAAAEFEQMLADVDAVIHKQPSPEVQRLVDEHIRTRQEALAIAGRQLAHLRAPTTMGLFLPEVPTDLELAVRGAVQNYAADHPEVFTDD
jgi:DNA-binding helix-hairpin-helix protein with protein kinase domain